jgi:hypothetical protein
MDTYNGLLEALVVHRGAKLRSRRIKSQDFLTNGKKIIDPSQIRNIKLFLQPYLEK